MLPSRSVPPSLFPSCSLTGPTKWAFHTTFPTRVVNMFASLKSSSFQWAVDFFRRGVDVFRHIVQVSHLFPPLFSLGTDLCSLYLLPALPPKSTPSNNSQRNVLRGAVMDGTKKARCGMK